MSTVREAFLNRPKKELHSVRTARRRRYLHVVRGPPTSSARRRSVLLNLGGPDGTNLSGYSSLAEDRTG